MMIIKSTKPRNTWLVLHNFLHIPHLDNRTTSLSQLLIVRLRGLRIDSCNFYCQPLVYTFIEYTNAGVQLLLGTIGESAQHRTASTAKPMKSVACSKYLCNSLNYMKLSGEHSKAVQMKRGGSIFVGGVILVVALTVFVFEQISIAAVNGWWADELFSLWATDPSVSFSSAFTNRIASDFTPPLYYTALYWLRAWVPLPIGQERTSVVTLNIVFIFVASSAVIGISRWARLTWLGLVSVSAFLLSGPVLTYTPEGRAYLLAMGIIFVASWIMALVIEEPHQRPHWACFAALGILAAMTHLYAAILCGCLAAGLIVLAVVADRRDLVVPGLALGFSATCTCGIWLATASSMMRYESATRSFQWFNAISVANLRAAWWEVRQLAIGGRAATVFLVALLSCTLVHRSTRALTVAFGVAFALFAAVPILASLKTPIISARYWLIGGPSLVVLLVFLASAGMRETMNNRWRMKPLALGLVAMAFLVGSSATGFLSARTITENKLTWKGADIVVPLIQHCPAASIHVWAPVGGAREKEYSQIAHVAADFFVNANAPATAWITPSHSTCPVIGWAENIVEHGDAFTINGSETDLLNLLKIRASATEIEIRRHSGGFVVLRR